MSVHAWKSLHSYPTLATPWIVACQTSLSMRFPRKEYWSGLPCPLQGIFQAQGLNPHLLCPLQWQVGFFTASTTWEAHIYV